MAIEAKAPNELPISRRERWVLPAKMPAISCAKRSAAWAGWAGALMRYRVPIDTTTGFWYETTFGFGRAARRAQRSRVLAAVFVPALLRRRAADGLARCTRGSGPRRRASIACSLRIRVLARRAVRDRRSLARFCVRNTTVAYRLPKMHRCCHCSLCTYQSTEIPTVRNA